MTGAHPRISGFTFVRDAVRLRYPVVPSVRSLLPLVDELVVNVGVSQDGTLELVRAIDDPRLVIFETRWDESQLERGRVLAHQTDLALARCRGDVCLYLQADEVLHDDDHARLRAALARLADDPGLEGLLFDYVHFYGSFHTVGVGRRWYRNEIRAVKNRRGVRSWRDAQGFRLGPGEGARKLKVASSGARVFHYGWVRPPAAQQLKVAELERLYHGEAGRLRRLAEEFSYDVGEKLRAFTGAHPAEMRDWVAREDWPFEPRPARLRRAHLREDLLDLFEAATGVRVGEYRNYELVR